MFEAYFTYEKQKVFKNINFHQTYISIITNNFKIVSDSSNTEELKKNKNNIVS